MSIESLEERYQNLKRGMDSVWPRLYHCAEQASAMQKRMRSILNRAADVCAACEHTCCEGLPLEGWFSIEDYVLFRMRYEKPSLPTNRIAKSTACSFLTPDGCCLPSDMRPFTCVKINCERLDHALRLTGEADRFRLLRNALDTILGEASQLLHVAGSTDRAAVDQLLEARDGRFTTI